MKKQLLLWSMLICIFTIGRAADIIFSDPNFKQAILNENPSFGTEISKEEALTVTRLDVNNSNISNIDGIEYFENLVTFICNNNNIYQITEAHTSTLTKLSVLTANDNNIFYIDVRACSLVTLELHNNPLEYAYLIGPSTFKSDYGFSFDFDNIKYVCISLSQYQNGYQGDKWFRLELSGVLFIDNCTAASLNQIEGTVTYDLDGDGCDSDDIPFTPYIAIDIYSGFEVTTVFPNELGQYNAFLDNGTYKFVPNLGPNEDYFQVVDQPEFNPSIPGTVIPDDIANLITDFCIESLGDFNDLEVTVYPIRVAVPGFEATYQIMYANNGTTTQSGTITLDYDSDVIIFDSSIPNIISNTGGQLTWGFQDLSPMEIVRIPVTFILNNPMDSPALNGGDILNFTASIIGANDETPDNNIMELAQTVVNSYDPNDKTCLEGDILDSDNVGGYLHYLIRFENEGTAEAINIRVTDVIDTTKLDIESFVPVTSSHSFTTSITNENEVEFAFNDINLPFDDGDNDGYVIFKIKSKDTLVEGDEIVNSAAIYFDFNFPIITEDSVVKVEREEVGGELGFSDYFTLSPNPTTGIMNLEVLDDNIEISYILLYDLAGVFKGFYFGTVRTIDVSNLYARTYIMQVLTNKGDFSTQFIKL